MTTTPSSLPSSSFSGFILREKRSRKLLLVAVAGAFIQWLLFKAAYPFADYFSDSYNYIESALGNMSVNVWPVGYARFLEMVHAFSRSDRAVTGIQYAAVIVAGLYFFFTVLFFYRPPRLVVRILYIFLFFNPVLLYLSNYISSDPIFLALSLLWFTQLIWMLERPALFRIVTHALVLVVLFTVRYNAMYYPLITAVALACSRYRIWAKAVGIVLPVVLIYMFIDFTSKKNQEYTGARQFSVFSGWQLANNALYMYPHIKVDSTAVPAGCDSLAKLVRQYFAIIPEEYKKQSPADGAFYIKEPGAPLKVYLQRYVNATRVTSNIKAWGGVAPVYGKYGRWLIKDHPVAFLRYFAMENAWVYILPPLEKLEYYNLNSNEVWETAMKWFNYSDKKVYALPGNDFQGYLLFLYPAVFLAINILFAGSLVFFLIKKGWKKGSPRFNRFMLLGISFWLVNMGFSILASPVVFRYQLFPMVIILTAGSLLLTFLDKEIKIFE
ncbi:MAG TPA: hypothetical protein VM802_27075 [Chitinophaga sp.]|uniref:hypothetical protein n=1 Tax=Chitinophaga sp. TaxID=1869181 RepID=UPI002BA6C1B8|nr:hypothetical protein [Chitinophaga sp.]HVI48561.1 hypothetical protein [Chitinophaga sp.]